MTTEQLEVQPSAQTIAAETQSEKPEKQQKNQQAIPAAELELLIQKVAEKTVRELLQKLGVKTAEIHEMQKDFAHLRTQRQATEQVRGWSRRIVLGIFLTGLCGMLWAGFKAALSVKS